MKIDGPMHYLSLRKMTDEQQAEIRREIFKSLQRRVKPNLTVMPLQIICPSDVALSQVVFVTLI